MSRSATKSAPKKGGEKAKSAAQTDNGTLPLGPVALTVEEAPTQPLKEVTITKGKTIKDVNGLVEELGLVKAIKRMEQPLIDDVKKILLDAGAESIEGDHYIGTITKVGGGGPGVKSVVDPKKFLALCEAKEIPPKKYLPALEVLQNKLDFLSKEEIAKCTVQVPTAGGTGGNRLDVEPRKDAPLELVEEIKEFARRANKGEIAVPEKLRTGGRK